MSRPKILVPARFSESASALRYQAEVNARRLISAIFEAGGEPLTVHPHAPGGSISHEQVAERFDFADGLVLPGGGDINPAVYGGQQHDEHYGMDREQDDFDLALARWAIATTRPLLAICRGLQVTNVALGGTLIAHLDQPHRSTSSVAVEADSVLGSTLGAQDLVVSCHHHQAVDRLADRLRCAAASADGLVEAAEMIDATGWFLGLQWHPEDTAASDPAQSAVFSQFIEATRVTRAVVARRGSRRVRAVQSPTR